MRKPILVPPDPTADPVYLTAAAISSVIQSLPSGTAYCIGIVLIVMMTGRLLQHKGSLARAALPFVVHLKWGWHRVERTMERGKFKLADLFDGAYQWCFDYLEVEPCDSARNSRRWWRSTVRPLTAGAARSGKRRSWAKGYWHRAGRAVRGKIVAAAVSVVLIRGLKVGLVRRVRFGESCEAAVEKLFQELPESEGL